MYWLILSFIAGLKKTMQPTKLRMKKLGVKLASIYLWEFQFSQAFELDFTEIKEAKSTVFR